jgi:hypothetical protein
VPSQPDPSSCKGCFKFVTRVLDPKTGGKNAEHASTCLIAVYTKNYGANDARTKALRNALTVRTTGSEVIQSAIKLRT